MLMAHHGRKKRRRGEGRFAKKEDSETDLLELIGALEGAVSPPPPSADELQLRRELQQLRRENKRLKTTARRGNGTVTSTYYTGDNWTVPSCQSRRSSLAPEHRRLRDPTA